MQITLSDAQVILSLKRKLPVNRLDLNEIALTHKILIGTAGKYQLISAAQTTYDELKRIGIHAK